MIKIWSKFLFYTSSFVAAFVLAFTSGCASGGYKTTRQYAGWLNSQNVVVRVILYLLTAIVFFFTLIIDYVVFNTIDFWSGKVSSGTYKHEKDGQTFVAVHSFQEGTQLRQSVITVTDSSHQLLQTVRLTETADLKIELYVDGVLRAKVDSLDSLPMITSFDKNGVMLERQSILMPALVAQR